MADNRKLLQEIMKRSEQLFSSSERYNNELMWDELSEFMLNNQHRFDGSSTSSAQGVHDSGAVTTKGAKKTGNLFDSTALKATEDLAAAFHGTLTNPATTWSKLRFQDDVLNNDPESVEWIEEVNRILHVKLNESNFDTEISKGYQSFAALANMVILQEQKEDSQGNFDGFRFKAMHLSQVAWSENKDGRVDTIARKFNMTARQAAEKWGTENLHRDLIRALEQTPDKEFLFLHMIMPREDKDVDLNELGLAPGNKRPVASIYVDMGHSSIVEESGYYENPIHVPRWQTTAGEVYGRGPGHIALPDTKTLNRLKKRGLESIDLQVNPPILANQRDVFGTLDMRPRGISVVKDINGIREFRSESRSDILQFSVQELRESITQIFFLDKLQLPPRTETGEMTAFEVSQRVEQMQRVLGPTLSRLNSELLQPLIVRAVKILLRSNVLPEMPELLKEVGVDVEIVFVNQLARSQQIQDISSIQQWVQNMAQLAQIDPAVFDNVDTDGIAKHTAKILGVPEVAIANDDTIEQVRQQRAQQQQQQQALDQANMAADTAAKAGLTDQGGPL